MKVAIYGAGRIGSTFGFLLSNGIRLRLDIL